MSAQEMMGIVRDYTRELEKVLSVECFHLNSSISRLRSLMMHLNYRLTWKTK